MKNQFKRLLLLVLSVFALAHNAAFAAMTYKHFADYVDITPTKTNNPEGLRAHYFAKQRVNDRAHDPIYKNNQWKLVMRRGLFLAQKDKAMSEIYRYLLGYATDVDIVEEKGDWYIARRKFTSFKKSYNPDREIRDYLRRDENNILVGKYLLLDDGQLINDSEVKQFKGLASVAVLTEFFGEADYGDWNFGYQVSDNAITAVFYDCEHALNFDADDDGEAHSNLENDLAKTFGKEFIEMTWYQREKQQMLQKIAATDFSVFENILRKNITGTSLDEAKWMFNKILNDPKVLPDYDRAEAKRQLDEVNKLDEKEYGIDPIIEKLRIRHQELRKQLGMQK